MTDGHLSSLTPREREILHLMAKGLSCREIASELAISELTVKTHRRNMLGKAGLCNGRQLIEHARQQNYLPRLVERPLDELLSARELQVMRLVIQGFTSKSISRQLEITDPTVRKHRENLLRKLNLRSIAQLVALYE
ncbi:LuxR C-terminal-related transcriptional regulator [Uliginosibacterium sp. H3]|uniref:LuxR C-terminal-related transcriptional regulator n=1 Tax=Uliginosibacterium silvisoli TaxID=3114758 RepID=A0ABU6K4D9_9RHOO|nr:LuxR C-terminal-related transcriptional regulator [Uliginosibacterium sp. H3]